MVSALREEERPRSHVTNRADHVLLVLERQLEHGSRQNRPNPALGVPAGVRQAVSF